jgi:hypothetical protein
MQNIQTEMTHSSVRAYSRDQTYFFLSETAGIPEVAES